MFENIMTEKITVMRATTYNKFAEAKYITLNLKGRIEWSEKTIVDDTGTNVVSLATVYCLSELKRNDKLFYENVKFRVEKVVQLKDINNKVQHFVAYIL